MTVPSAPYFRIFIDAATLKVNGVDTTANAYTGNFRIFIDAATLKVESMCERQRGV